MTMASLRGSGTDFMRILLSGDQPTSVRPDLQLKSSAGLPHDNLPLFPEEPMSN
jgi:hypothetical protein